MGGNISGVVPAKRWCICSLLHHDNTTVGGFFNLFFIILYFSFFSPLLREEQTMRKKKGMGNNLFIDFVWYTKREEKIG